MIFLNFRISFGPFFYYFFLLIENLYCWFTVNIISFSSLNIIKIDLLKSLSAKFNICGHSESIYIDWFFSSWVFLCVSCNFVVVVEKLNMLDDILLQLWILIPSLQRLLTVTAIFCLFIISLLNNSSGLIHEICLSCTMQLLMSLFCFVFFNSYFYFLSLVCVA